MQVFIYPDGRGVATELGKPNLRFKSASLVTEGVNLPFVVFADSEKKFVRVSVPPAAKAKYCELIKALFSDVSDLGNYDSGFHGVEFTVKDLQITLT